MPTFEESKAGYGAMWRSCTVEADRIATADKVARRIIANRGRYEAVERGCGVPWFFLACLHARESDGDFRGVLHNGDRVIGTGQKTYHVPAGRGPFATWEEAAVDALTMPGKHYELIKDWSIERMLYTAEGFNGWGYSAKGVNSPYIWGGTNHQQPGKYVADHVWSSTAVDSQLGVAVLLKRLAAADPGIATRIAGGAARIEQPPASPAPVPKTAGTAKAAGKVAAGGAAAGTLVAGGVAVANHVTQTGGLPTTALVVLGIAVAIGLAAAVVFFIRKR